MQVDLVICDRDQKIRLAYNEFEYKKTKDTYKLGDTFLEKGHFFKRIYAKS
jgi:hypothetical protein